MCNLEVHDNNSSVKHPIQDLDFFLFLNASQTSLPVRQTGIKGCGKENYLFFPLFCLACGPPRGGVMGRPVFKPPYGNFFLSAGCKVSKEKEKVL